MQNYFLALLTLIVILESHNSFAQENVPPQKIDSAAVTPPITTDESVSIDMLMDNGNSEIESKAETVTEPINAKDEPVMVEPATPATPVVEKIKDENQEIKKSNFLKHGVIRRITVFPFFTNGDYKQESEVSWWKAREFLSEQQRFLVATKRFLEQKDVYQPRKSLKITDVVLLSQILDSDCLMTGFIENRNFVMQAYAGQDGQMLWTKSFPLNAAKPIREQLENASTRLVQDFLSNIPYQGFQIIDPLNDKPYVEDGNNILVRIDVGAKSAAQKGQKVQWIEIERKNAEPLFQGGSVIKILAEGEVISNENQVLTVNVKRAKDLTILDKKAIVHIPAEFKRIADNYAIHDAINTEASIVYLSEPMVNTEQRSRETRPLLTALASIANIVLVVLLAL